MLELPEAVVMAHQLEETVEGRTIARVTALASPHRFAFFNGDPAGYDAALRSAVVERAGAIGGMVELVAGAMSLLVSDGAVLRFHESPSTLPRKHQLLVEFADRTSLSVSVQMYAGIMCYPTGTWEDPYYVVARERPSPLGDGFTDAWFRDLLMPTEVRRLSLKAALATEQRIPGLGNGVLQDILWAARLHPRRSVSSLADDDVSHLHATLTAVVREMAARGGRDTETDLFGVRGGYRTVMSRLHLDEPCPRCGGAKAKEAYLGGSVYTCPACQPR
jgi:formamidopyrimidine-DNA glycosylase